jgi:hypothetical protein
MFATPGALMMLSQAQLETLIGNVPAFPHSTKLFSES